MSTGRSSLTFFGFWVAWVYLLSLVVVWSAGQSEPPPARPVVRFVDAGETFTYDVGAGANGLGGVEAEISATFDRPIEIPVTALPVAVTPDGVEPARPGLDYAADRDAVFCFPAGSKRGTLRMRDDLLDVAVTPDVAAAAPRRFRLRLDGTADVVVAADPEGFRAVDIPPGADLASAGIKARFRDLLVEVDERELEDHRFVIEADRSPDDDAELMFSLFRRNGTGQVPVIRFSGTFPANAREKVMRLRDCVSSDDLRRIGANYDPRPGIDTWYELHLDARPPLISAEDPCFTTIFCRDRDEAATLDYRFENAAGEPIRRVLPDDPFYVVAELSKPIEMDCPVRPVVDGRPLTPGGVIPAGATRSERLGPYRLPDDPTVDADEVLVNVSASPQAGQHVCKTCGGRPGGCEHCRGVCTKCGGPPGSCPECSGKCQGCGGRPGGCPQCRGKCASCGDKPGGCDKCRGKCPQCGGRSGGCAACGNGSGVCRNCGGAGGSCSVCGGGGGGGGSGGGSSGGGGGGSGSGGGGGGGGSGGSGGGRCPVTQPADSSLPKGPPVPGDFMIFLVNNQRLHEPGDVITDRVREAIRDRRPYNQGAIVINDEGKETVLTEKGGAPTADRAFEPFSADAQDLGAQAARVVDTISRKRRNAANPNIRTLVVWPEREFVSAQTLEVLKPLADDGHGPVSLLLPDADPERAREAAAALEGGQGRITVRSPKSDELVEQVADVLDAIAAKPTDRLNVDGKQP